LESIEVMALGESAIRQCIGILLKLDPYRSNRCLMLGGRGVREDYLDYVG